MAVLDVSIDPSGPDCPHSLRFDGAPWNDLMAGLKPLGLAVLITRDEKDDPCLCALPRCIGFQSDAADAFNSLARFYCSMGDGTMSSHLVNEHKSQAQLFSRGALSVILPV